MKVVIQCAGSKDSSAGYWREDSGRRVEFVAQPPVSSVKGQPRFARPDDLATDQRTFRELLINYNIGSTNPLGLFEAWRLYDNPVYADLVKSFGPENVYIMSAGWGLVRASYRLPQYDITFSQSGGPIKRRGKSDGYSDFCHLPEDETDDIRFVGGKDYVPLFIKLTNKIRNRTIYYNSQTRPSAPGCRLIRFETTRRTNWHYECANVLCAGA